MIWLYTQERFTLWRQASGIRRRPTALEIAIVMGGTVPIERRLTARTGYSLNVLRHREFPPAMATKNRRFVEAVRRPRDCLVIHHSLVTPKTWYVALTTGKFQRDDILLRIVMCTSGLGIDLDPDDLVAVDLHIPGEAMPTVSHLGRPTVENQRSVPLCCRDPAGKRADLRSRVQMQAVMSTRYRVRAGLLLLAAGVVTLLGFVTAASLYPGYSLADQTISALGAADAPAESETVFNVAMALAGLLAVAGAAGLKRAGLGPWLAGVVGATGLGGMIGIAVFPAQTGTPHAIAALIAFGGIGLSAVIAARTFGGAFGWVSLVLGVAELGALAAFIALKGANPLGVGGLERWVAYLGAVWVIAFGGFMIANESRGVD